MQNAKCEINGILNVTQLMFFFLPSSGINQDIRQFRAISHGNPSDQILSHGHHQAFETLQLDAMLIWVEEQLINATTPTACSDIHAVEGVLNPTEQALSKKEEAQEGTVYGRDVSTQEVLYQTIQRLG